MSNNSGDVESEEVLGRGALVRRLIIIALIMFGFGYALVPLYEVFCRVTGFGGKTDIIEAAAANSASLIDRNIDVTFTSHSHTSLPWEFKPLTKGLNVTPARAGFYFKKTECFCFTKQVLQPGEEQEMAVRFLLDSDMPEDVHELTLSYTFFDNEKHAGQ